MSGVLDPAGQKDWAKITKDLTPAGAEQVRLALLSSRKDERIAALESQLADAMGELATYRAVEPKPLDRLHREHLAGVAAEGTHCVVCGRWDQEYRRQISGEMVKTLAWLCSHVTDSWVHMASNPQGRGADSAKLRYWGLIVEQPVLRPDGGRAGWWQATDLGRDWLPGKCTISRYAVIYQGELVRLEGPAVAVADVVGNRFDLRALLAGDGS